MKQVEKKKSQEMIQNT